MFVIVRIFSFFYISAGGSSSDYDENQEGIKLIACFIENLSLYPLFLLLSIDN